MSARRFHVETEHIRGERRIYWVEDRSKRYRRGYESITEPTKNKQTAERQCDKLNGLYADPLQHQGGK